MPVIDILSALSLFAHLLAAVCPGRMLFADKHKVNVVNRHCKSSSYAVFDCQFTSLQLLARLYINACRRVLNAAFVAVQQTACVVRQLPKPFT